MTVKFSPVFNGWQGFSPGGLPLNLGYVYTYAAGGTTPTATYTTSAGNVANANPIVLGTDGRPPQEIWLTAGTAYRFDLYDVLGNLIKTYDNLVGINDVNAGDVTFSQATSYASGTVGARLKQYVSVQDAPYNAVGDGVTDDYPAFAAAYTAAAAAHRALYIPALPPGKYYKLSAALEIVDQSFTLFGGGVASLICAFNASGGNAITVKATHCTIRDIGITGILNSGHGIQLGLVGTPAHQTRLSNLWIGWMGANALEIVEAISCTYINVNSDMDQGYRPATLIGASEGAQVHGFNIHKSATGINNDQKFLGCTLNSACNATGTELRVGLSGTGSFQMLQWVGGLIQGQAVGAKLIHLAGVNRCDFFGGDYEPNGGITGTFTIASCNYVNFKDALMQGDLVFTSSNYCSVRDSTINGLSMDSCGDMAIDHVIYGSTGGVIKDYDGTAVLTNLVNSTTALHKAGNSLKKGVGQTYLNERMQYWTSGGAPGGCPSHFTQSGGTLTRDTGTVLVGTYSAKLVASAASDHLRCFVDVTGIREVYVDAWVYNVTTTGLAKITGINTNTSADSAISSITNDKWERIQVTFTPAAGCTSLRLEFGVNTTGTVYWGIAVVTVPSVPNVEEMVLASNATPALCANGLTINSFVTGDTTTVTNFTNPIVGELIGIRFAHAKTITNNANIVLTGAANFVGKSGDTLTLRYGIDGVFREVSRMVS